MALESNVGGRENVQYQQASFLDGHAGRFFEITSLFGWWSSAEGDKCESVDGGGGQDDCGEGCKGGLTLFRGAVRGGCTIVDNRVNVVVSGGGGACAGCGGDNLKDFRCSLELSQGSGKTPHTVSHSFSIPAMRLFF